MDMRLLVSVLLTVLASFGIVVTGGAGPALACSCAFNRVPAYVGYADEVYTGTLVDVERPSTNGVWSSGDPVTYTVAVDAVYDGDVGSVAVFESAVSSASCGLDGMMVDRRYLVFTTMDGKVPTASLCGGTGPATPKRLAAVERLLGEPSTPSVAVDKTAAAPDPVRAEDATTPGLPTWAVGGAILASGVLLAVVFGLRRRSS